MRTVLRQRLFQRFLLSLGGALVVSFGLAAAVTLVVGTRSLRANIQTELDGTANTIHLTLEAFLDARSSDLRLASQAEAMDDVLTGDANFRIQNALMELLRTTHGTYDELFVVDAHGIVISGTRMERIGESVPFPIASLAPTTDGSWLTPGPMRVPGADKRVLPMARPLRSRLAQQNSGWIVALVGWPRISALVSGVSIAGRPQRPSAFAVLFADEALRDPELARYAAVWKPAPGLLAEVLRFEAELVMLRADWDGARARIAHALRLTRDPDGQALLRMKDLHAARLAGRHGDHFMVDVAVLDLLQKRDRFAGHCRPGGEPPPGQNKAIDRIAVAGQDPDALKQLEGAIVALRGVVSHVASNDTLWRLDLPLKPWRG